VQQGEGEELSIGVTDYAQEQLGQVVFVECLKPGTELRQGVSFGTIESAKTASELIAPVSGFVKAINEKLQQEPWLVNEDPYGQGWILKLVPSNIEEFKELLDSRAYHRLLLGAG
jgi:glycine cleavage system H protein